MQAPRARTKDLVIERLDDETLVYDLKSHRAHCLNPAASLVWSQCDGRSSVSSISSQLSERYGLPKDEAVVQLALQRLAAARLLEDAGPAPALSRREALRRLALAGGVAALLPAVATIKASAQPGGGTCQPNVGDSCQTIPCCPGLNCNVITEICE